MPAVTMSSSSAPASPAPRPPSCSPRPGSAWTSSTSTPRPPPSVPASRCRATPYGCCASSASGTQLPRSGLRLRQPWAARPRPAGTLVAEIPDASTGGPDLPATLGMPRPVLARILAERALAAGAKLRFGTTFSPAVAQDGGRRRRHVRRRLGAVATTLSLAPTDCVGTRRTLGINRRAQVDRHGDLAGVRAASGERDRTDLYYGGPATLPATAPPAKTRSMPTSSRTPDRSEPHRAGSSSAHARALAGLPRPVGRHPRVPHRSGPGALHVVRNACPGWAVEPRPSRPHRRRRAHLPANARAGRRAGAGRRGRSGRTLLVTRDCARPVALGRLPRAAGLPAQTVVDASNQLAQWQLDARAGRRPWPDRHRSPPSSATRA